MNEAQRVYQHLRSLWSGPRKTRAPKQRPGSLPFMPGRDPKGIADVLGSVADELGWTPQLAQHEVFARWADITGPDVSGHSAPVALEDGVLTVRCDSTAWATQLGFLRYDLAKQLQSELPDAQITTIRFIGPDVPSWKKGLRATQGRGPRDTYG